MKPDTTKQAEKALREFSVALNQAIVYGARHPLTTKAAEHAYNTLRQHLSLVATDFIVARADDGIVVNNRPVHVEGPVSRVLIPAMNNFSLNSLSIESGITPESFLKLIQILAKGTQYKSGQVSQNVFKRALEVAGVSHVGIHMVRYERVRDDEKIVAKKARMTEDSDGKKNVPPPIDQIFAEAVDHQDVEKITEVAGKMLKQPKAFSRMILSVLERPQQSSEKTENFFALIGESLEELFNKLPETPTALRNAARKVEKLRKQLLEDGRQYPFVKSDYKHQLDNLLTDTRNAMKVEMIAEEYRKRKQALAKSEKQISRFVKRKDLETVVSDDLREKLAGSGMSFAEWSELATKADAGSKKKQEKGAIERIRTMAENLRQSTESHGEETIGKALKAAEDAGRELAVITTEIADKIRALVEEEKALAKTPPKERPAKASSRRKLLAKLAEIVQELCQPLSVITASIDMIAGNQLGDVTESQLSMLKLAGEGAERMQKLIYALMEITDVPEDLHPDQEIISQLY